MRMVKEGFESEYESLRQKKINLQEDKAAALEKAKAEIDARFEDREKTIESLLMLISDEVPEEARTPVDENGETELVIEEGQIENNMIVGVNEVPEGTPVLDGVKLVGKEELVENSNTKVEF